MNANPLDAASDLAVLFLGAMALLWVVRESWISVGPLLRPLFKWLVQLVLRDHIAEERAAHRALEMALDDHVSESVDVAHRAPPGGWT